VIDGYSWIQFHLCSTEWQVIRQASSTGQVQGGYHAPRGCQLIVLLTGFMGGKFKQFNAIMSQCKPRFCGDLHPGIATQPDDQELWFLRYDSTQIIQPQGVALLSPPIGHHSIRKYDDIALIGFSVYLDPPELV
jgi:hypothetical protein